MARRAGGRRPPALLAVPATVVAGAALVPVAYLAVRAGESGLGRVADTLLQGRTAALAARSLALAAAVTAAAVTLGIALAWTTERCRLPGGRLWQVLAAVPLAVPTYVAGFAFVSRFPWLAGFLGAWLVLTLCSYPYVYLPVAAALRGLDGTLEEVARSLGRSRAATFWHVTLPQLRPAAAAGALLVGLYALSDFGAVSLLRFTAFTRAIYLSYQASFDRTPAAVLGCVLVGLTALLVAVEVRTRGRARYSRPGGGAARRVPPRPAGGPWRWAPVLLPAAVAALALGVPAAALVTWLGRGVADATLAETWRAALTSFGLSVAGAVVTTAAALPLGVLAARYRGGLGSLLDGATWLAHALPGIVVALSLVFFATRSAPWLYQRSPLLVFAYLVLFLPLAVGAVRASVAQAPPVLDDVARSLGRRPAGVLAAVTAPLAAPGIAAGAALVFLTCMKELPATLLLRPTGLETLATRVWSATSIAAYSAAALPAALLVVAAALPTWLLVRRGEVPS
jgi:iron(III) transport system permease protein